MADINRISPVNDEEITLKEVIYKFTSAFQYLKSRWILILLFSIIGLIGGLVYALNKKPQYEAVMTFALQDDQNPSSVAYSGLASQLGMDINGVETGTFAGNNIINLLQSRSVIEKTLLTTTQQEGKNITLAELYIQFNKLRDKWKDYPKLSKVQFLPNDNPEKYTLIQDSVLKIFYNDIKGKCLTIDKVEDATSIISVTVRTTSPVFSKAFTEALVKKVSDFYVETKTQKTLENVLILQHQKDSVRQELNRALSGVAASTDLNPNPNPNMQVLHVGAQRKTFDVQVNQTMLSELVRNLEIAKVTLRKETPLIQIIDKPNFPLDVKGFSKFKGMFIGFFVGLLLIVIFLLTKRFLEKVMS